MRLSKGFAKLTEDSGIGKDAHHVYPQKFRQDFEDVKINIDSSENLQWVDKEFHSTGSYAYNVKWKVFLSSDENIGVEAIKTFAEKMKKFFN